MTNPKALLVRFWLLSHFIFSASKTLNLLQLKLVLVLLYKPMEGTMEEISRDYNPNWMTAVKLIDDDNFIGAENSDNIFFCQKNSASADEDERSSLKGTGYFHTGEMINCFVEGSLVMSVLGESSIQPKATFLFGSTMGHVGLGMIHNNCIF